MSQKRTAKRLSLDYEVSVDVGLETSFYTGMLKDISTGGVFIATDREHRVGSALQLRLAFPGLKDPVEVEGVVRWHRSRYASGDMPEGIGVAFENLTDNVKAAINKYLSKTDPLYFETTDEYSEW
jgi:uncharacterized protein (TIGR02266 family)